MELDQAINDRRSNRKFKADPLTDEQIDQILDAARQAPSASNVQPWRFIVVKSAEMREKLSVVSKYKFVFKAPVVFVCCADMNALETRDRRITELVEAKVFNDVEIVEDVEQPKTGHIIGTAGINGYMSLNVAIAVEHMALKAVDLGLGSCWVGGFDAKKTKEILDLPDNLYQVMLLPVGYPVNKPSARPRLSMDELVVKTV